MVSLQQPAPLKDRRISIDQLPDGLTIRHILIGQSERISRLAWAPDGQRLASPSFDRTIRIWDTQTGQPFAYCRVTSTL